MKFPCNNCLVLSSCKNLCFIFTDSKFQGLYSCRYGDILLNLLKHLNTKEILNLSYENDYQGYVDIDALLEDGRILSYKYYYGSCAGCDEWEALNISNIEIEEVMMKEATFFDNIDQYNKWLKMKQEQKGK